MHILQRDAIGTCILIAYLSINIGPQIPRSASCAKHILNIALKDPIVRKELNLKIVNKTFNICLN